jgi:hypothetical protein
MPVRTETYLGGRLVKQVDMIDVTSAETGPGREHVDGRHIWLLDGHEIDEDASVLAEELAKRENAAT